MLFDQNTIDDVQKKKTPKALLQNRSENLEMSEIHDFAKWLKQNSVREKIRVNFVSTGDQVLSIKDEETKQRYVVSFVKVEHDVFDQDAKNKLNHDAFVLALVKRWRQTQT